MLEGEALVEGYGIRGIWNSGRGRKGSNVLFFRGRLRALLGGEGWDGIR